MQPIDRRMNFKKQLEFYLDHLDMTAAQLARKANLPKQTVHNWLTGQMPRNFDQVKKIAEALGNIPLDNLLYGEGLDDSRSRSSSKVLDLLMSDDQWLSGTFEIKIRRVKK